MPIATTRDPDTGQWRPGKSTNPVAAKGVKMTPSQVAAWEKPHPGARRAHRVPVERSLFVRPCDASQPSAWGGERAPQRHSTGHRAAVSKIICL